MEDVRSRTLAMSGAHGTCRPQHSIYVLILKDEDLTPDKPGIEVPPIRVFCVLVSVFTERRAAQVTVKSGLPCQGYVPSSPLSTNHRGSPHLGFLENHLCTKVINFLER